MRTVCSLFIATLLIFGGITTAFAHQPVPRRTPGDKCGRGAKVAKPGPEGASILVGVITKIDHNKNTIALKTDDGDLEILASAEDLKGLKEGDTLVVYMTDDGEPPSQLQVT